MDDEAALFAEALEIHKKGEAPLAEFLEGQPGSRDEFMRLFEVVEAVSSVPDITPQPAFVSAARSRVLAKISAPQTVTILSFIRHIFQSVQPKYERRYAVPLVAVAVLLISLVTGGTVLASNASIPGDWLYPLKITVEDLRLVMAAEEDRAGLTLAFADERVSELKKLVEAGRFEDIFTAIERFENLLNSVPPALKEDFIQEHLEVLTGLFYQLPEQAKLTIEWVLDIFSQTAQPVGATPVGTASPTAAGTLLPADTPKPTATSTLQSERHPAAARRTPTPINMTPAATEILPVITAELPTQELPPAGGLPPETEIPEPEVPPENPPHPPGPPPYPPVPIELPTHVVLPTLPVAPPGNP
jgi:hypothetical protein